MCAFPSCELARWHGAADDGGAAVVTEALRALVRRSRFVPKGHAPTLCAAVHAAVAGHSAIFMVRPLDSVLQEPSFGRCGS